MSWNLHSTFVQDGDLVYLVSPRRKAFILRLEKGGEFHSHRGIIKHDDMIGKPWGSRVASHMGETFLVLQPSLADLIRELPRTTQILYPKDIGLILVNMSIGEGQHILEAGTGSGSLTCAFAFAVGAHGRVTSYDVRADVQNLAAKNLQRLGLAERVTLKLRDIAAGFDEREVDAVFLDVPNPQDYTEQARQALKPGGFFGSILPTTNQVTRLVAALRAQAFDLIEVCEVLLRHYKPEPERLRPVDRMVAHTGFLIFARAVQAGSEALSEEHLSEMEMAHEDDGEAATF
ncbi:tRNA (adenine-N1)-methyltransferase [Thermanaerothrix daxensis]|uniref:tRNA (adenine-N1)-methyltransferase n=1 Tax=Thermanaerothrix daxensis TaxID=869279 RepID=UPI0006C91B34|nr:tRNA (adenine-N1)-methyltransferase [Thermanaerothrix daxensis]